MSRISERFAQITTDYSASELDDSIRTELFILHEFFGCSS
jgi:hypothetical protein